MSQSRFINTTIPLPRTSSLTTLIKTYLKPSSSQPTNTIPTPTPTTFHPFPHLPTELRVLIWRTTFPHNRSIHLNILTCSHPSRSAEALTFAAPITLSVNRESRYETLRFYHCQSHLDPPSNQNSKSGKRGREPWHICFNPTLTLSASCTSTSPTAYPTTPGPNGKSTSSPLSKSYTSSSENGLSHPQAIVETS